MAECLARTCCPRQALVLANWPPTPQTHGSPLRCGNRPQMGTLARSVELPVARVLP